MGERALVVRGEDSTNANSAARWTTLEVPRRPGPEGSPKPNLRALSFSLDSVLWAVGEEGAVLRSHADGSLAWVAAPTRDTLLDLGFSADGKGFAVTEGGALRAPSVRGGSGRAQRAPTSHAPGNDGKRKMQRYEHSGAWIRVRRTP